ncbi:MAG: DUF5680 domain-containing protein [Clostridiaceae bacterium]|nr:DUF5680 domain-containing protein [Clostridiaceae bacterium]
MSFAEKFKNIRKEKRLSQEDIAKKLNISRQAVAKWETSQGYPDISNLIQISDILHITIDELVKEDRDCNKSTIEERNIDLNKMISFLCEAKRKTYAGKGTEEECSSRPNSHDLIYAEGDFKYIDSYIGSEIFAGEEGIWIKDKAIWSMNYCGRVLRKEFSGDFLKESLLLVPEEQPFRGPKSYKNGKYTYHCFVDGDFDWFQGREEILYGEITVYECYFHGGKLVE